MPRVKCTKCFREETVLRAGFIRGKQRFFCKECNYHFTLYRERDAEKPAKRKGYATTIIDIAKVIGISVSTVSRALKDHPDISDKTKKAVKAIATELNYQPNTLAQSLTKRETRTIGVIIPDIETQFFSALLTGIHDTATLAGYKVMIGQSRESHKTEVANTHAFMTNWVDGLLICHSKETQTFDHIKLYLKSGIPIIHFDRVCDELDTSKVLLDDVNGAYQVTDHLITQGCRRIVILSGPEFLCISKLRLEGYLKALKKHSIEVDQLLIRHTDLSVPSILDHVDQVLEECPDVDAFFCISDVGALRTMIHLKNKGIKIPEQICVAGFGNEPIDDLIEPGLTSYNLQTYKIGETVVKTFLDQLIEGEDYVKKNKLIKGNLVARASTLRIKPV